MKYHAQTVVAPWLTASPEGKDLGFDMPLLAAFDGAFIPAGGTISNIAFVFAIMQCTKQGESLYAFVFFKFSFFQRRLMQFLSFKPGGTCYPFGDSTNAAFYP